MAFQLQLGTDAIHCARPLPPLCVPPHTPLRDILSMFQQQGRGCVLVVDGERLVGIFTERDALRLMAARQPLDTPVQHGMSSPPVTVAMTDPVERAIREMWRGGYRHLPVVDEQGRPVGVLPVANVLHYLVEHFPHYIYNLPPVPHHSLQRREGA